MPTDVPPSPSPQCPNCGAPLPEHAPQGLCPRCLFAGLADATDDAGVAAAPLPSPKPEDLAPHFPQLEILEYLGRGGMGIVYKARQKALDRFVALKLLAPERVGDPAFADRFAREAQALAKLNHPNIVTIHDFGEAGGFFYLLMEYIDGVNLRQAMKAGRFTPEQALTIVPPICDALQFAHERGIVHRDIKPENLLLDRDGRVMIADFGIAKMLGAGGSTGIAESQPAGTPQYMAPEQRTAPTRVDHRADIYSLGVVFYEMLTGELPAGRIEAPSSRMRGVHVDVRIDEIVLRALEQAPEMRYQTAMEFRSQVETVKAGGDAAQSSPGVAATAPSAGAQFSRKAVIGACWAPLFPIAFVLFTAVSYTAVGSGPRPSGPPWWVVLIAGAMSLAGLAAPFGTTILGWIAVGEIRRSAGKLSGLALAVFDGLIFPLGALGGLVTCFWWWVFRVFLYPREIDRLRIDGPAVTVSRFDSIVYEHGAALVVICTLLTVVPLFIFIVRKVWRAVNGEPQASSPIPWRKVFAVVLAIFVLVAALMASWWGNRVPPSSRDDYPTHAHVGGNDGSIYTARDKTRLHYVAYHPGGFSTSSGGSQNRHSVSWLETATVMLRNGRPFAFHRDSVYPDNLRINGVEYDLRQGRVFVLRDDGFVERLELFPSLDEARNPAALTALMTARGIPTAPAQKVTPAKGPLTSTGVMVTRQAGSIQGWYCQTAVPAGLRPEIEVGERVRILVHALPHREFPGTVEDISPSPTPSDDGLTYAVAVGFNQVDVKAFQNRMTVSIEFDSATRPSKLTRAPRSVRRLPTGLRVGLLASSADETRLAIANDGPALTLLDDGRRVPDAGWKASVEILDAKTGKSIAAPALLEEEEKKLLDSIDRPRPLEVKSLAFSPDSSTLAVGTSLGQVKLFDARTGQLLRTLDDREANAAAETTPPGAGKFPRAIGRVHTLAFSPDGVLLAVGGGSISDAPLRAVEPGEWKRIPTAPGRLKVWNAKTGELQHDLVGHAELIDAVAFSPDGRLLVSAGDWWGDGEHGRGVRLWDPHAGGKLQKFALESFHPGVQSISFSPDGQTMVVGGGLVGIAGGQPTREGLIYSLRLPSGSFGSTCVVPGGAKPVAYSRGGASVVVLCGNYAWQLRDAKSLELTADVRPTTYPTSERWNDLAISAHADRLIVGGVDADQRGFLEWWEWGGDAAATIGASAVEEARRDALKAELEQAKLEAEDAEARFAAGVYTPMEVLSARGKVNIFTAQLAGDEVAAAKARLETARGQLEIATKRFEVGGMSAAERAKFNTAVTVAEAGLREAEAKARSKDHEPK